MYVGGGGGEGSITKNENQIFIGKITRQLGITLKTYGFPRVQKIEELEQTNIFHPAANMISRLHFTLPQCIFLLKNYKIVFLKTRRRFKIS